MAAAGFGIFFVLFMALMVGSVAFWIAAIVDVIRPTEFEYRMAGTEKTTWVLVVVLVGWIGALIWWFGPRQRVKAMEGRAPQAIGPPPGWYPDPAGSGSPRWWDGARWT